MNRVEINNFMMCDVKNEVIEMFNAMIIRIEPV